MSLYGSIYLYIDIDDIERDAGIDADIDLLLALFLWSACADQREGEDQGGNNLTS